ncbi:toluene tolerance protein [Pseudomonas abieticivorans]|uniref:toluene tolerance protein n=1 Tax=Pseudomonas abieticivorans TaxID=2931382 RepID=UPI0020C175E9|nr:toluene tolerance protein [Pseudomonas sp. PIA16]
MQPLDHSTYLALREGANVLEADGSGDKVLQLRDGRFLKLFRRKRLLTSAALYPYAQRFADNTKALQERDIPCPDILAVYRIASIERDAVYYEPLAGDTVRHLIDQPELAAVLRIRLGGFVAQLHDAGVYFRSLHLGNVVITPEQRLGLIDIADLKCQRSPLTIRRRLRNFRHLMRYEQDYRWLLGDDGGKTFLAAYQAALAPRSSRPGMMERLQELFC